MIAPIVMGQLPIIVDRGPADAGADAVQLPIIVDREPADAGADAVQLPIIVNGTPPTLGAPIETSSSRPPPVMPPQAPPAPPPQPLPAPPQPLPAPPQPLPVPPPQPLPVPPPQPLPVPPPQPLPVPLPQRLPTAPPAPIFEIEVVPSEEPIEPATFGGVIGVGQPPVPIWIGPGENPYPTLDETLPIIEMSSFEPVVSFRRPIAGMPGDPPDDGILLQLIQRRSAPPPMQERGDLEEAAPSQPVVPQAWPEYRIQAPAPCRRWANWASQPSEAPPRPPLGSRVYELMIWPLRLLTEPFRDF